MTDKKTLEEVAEKLTKDFPHYSVRENMDNSEIKSWFLEALEKGAKWQAERMYDAKEVNNLLGKLIEGNICSVAGYKLIEEFKKK